MVLPQVASGPPGQAFYPIMRRRQATVWQHILILPVCVCVCLMALIDLFMIVNQQSNVCADLAFSIIASARSTSKSQPSFACLFPWYSALQNSSAAEQVFLPDSVWLDLEFSPLTL